jgi:hypothetical protein
MKVSGYTGSPRFPAAQKSRQVRWRLLLKSLDWINQPDRNPSSAIGIGNA